MAGPAASPSRQSPWIGAVAGKRIARTIVRDEDVSHFRVRPSVQQAPVDEGASAHAGPNGHVEKIATVARGAPSRLSQGRGVDVRIERNLHVQRALDGRRQSRSSATRLGRGSDEAEGGRVWVGSIGPNDQFRCAAIGNRARKNEMTAAIVSAGVVVGNSAISASSGPLPTPQTNLFHQLRFLQNETFVQFTGATKDGQRSGSNPVQ